MKAGFAAGMFFGAMAGIATAAMIDMIPQRDKRKIKRTTRNAMHRLGHVMDCWE